MTTPAGAKGSKNNDPRVRFFRRPRKTRAFRYSIPVKRVVRVDEFPLTRPFRTAQATRELAKLIVIELHRGGYVGRGECFVPDRYWSSIPALCEQLRRMPAHRERLRREWPVSSTRSALDCALWDLECKQSGMRIWELAKTTHKPVRTMFTIGIASLDEMEAQARAHATWPVLKIKAEAERAIDRVRAVHRGAPQARLVVDANASWTIDEYLRISPELAKLNVSVIEQPLPPEQDNELMMARRPMPLCADESFRVADDVDRLAFLYDLVNVKLDKAGGLTEALDAARRADAADMAVMVGCMVSSSLGIAPAWVVAQLASYADLDGPLHLSADRQPALHYDEWNIHPPSAELWG